MQILRSIDALRAARAALAGRVALVPTMGALHDGHMALIEAAQTVADHVIASIFVNPRQFGPNEDFARYPRAEAADVDRLQRAGVALLWAPDVATMYPDGFATRISVAPLGARLCGVHRPGHFDGVATVVAKLFLQCRPDIALFGEKDWQQLVIIRRMVADLDLPVAIQGVPTQREADGLARSSRNVYLPVVEREAARALPDALTEARAALLSGQSPAMALSQARHRLETAGFSVDYIELVGPTLEPAAGPGPEVRLVAAARLGTTRLIDNLPVAI